MKLKGKQFDYSIEFLNSAAKEFRKLNREIQNLLIAPIDSLVNNPYSYKTKKLRNADLYRIRIGDYRIIYQIDEVNKIVIITKIGHRKEVYK